MGPDPRAQGEQVEGGTLVEGCMCSLLGPSRELGPEGPDGRVRGGGSEGGRGAGPSRVWLRGWWPSFQGRGERLGVPGDAQ